MRKWLYLLLLLQASLLAPRAPGQPVTVTAEAVDSAIAGGVNYLLKQRNSAGHWEADDRDNLYWAGDTGLALLALLYAGQDPREPEIKRALDWLSEQPLKATYTYGVRAHVLALAGKPYHKRLQADLDWLVKACWPRGSRRPGGYDYMSASEHGGGSGRFDNSNTQFGVLGVWMATEAGLGRSGLEHYWRLVEDHWTLTQRPDGGWTYSDGGSSTGSMTAAGLASLFVVLDRLHAHSGHRRAGHLRHAISNGLDWLGREFGPDNPHGDSRWRNYYLYGVERVGRASGRKYFRGRDWFREGAADLLARQKHDGSWPSGGSLMSELRDTSFAVMFLAHGRAPLLMNKLEWGEEWDHHYRDLPTLTRFAEGTFERLMNWQSVGFEGQVHDFLEAPILYITGKSAFEVDDSQLFRLQEYCRQGGLILAVPGEPADEFLRSMRQLSERLFPEFPPRPLLPDHPIFSGAVQFPIARPPQVLEVHNGVRSLMLIVERDIAKAWNRNDTRGGQADFQLGCNLYLYATDKSAPRSRLETPDIPERATPITRTVRVGRIRHAGFWDVEPAGWTRLVRYLRNETGLALAVTSGVTLDGDALLDMEIAHITGLDALRLSTEELAGLRRFITSGGTLIADSACGSPDFNRSFDELIEKTFGAPMTTAPESSALLTGDGLPGGVDLGGVGLRRSARTTAGRYPLVRGLYVGRRLAVISSPLDFSVGLLGTPVYDCQGYSPRASLDVARNLFLYAAMSSTEQIRVDENAGADVKPPSR